MADETSSASPDSKADFPGGQLAGVVHEVDGIQEYDNHLPNWWLVTLYGAIAFAAVYWFQYQVLGAAETQEHAYRREMAALAERQGKSVPITEDSLLDMARDADALSEGATLYAQNCVACHGPAGGGVVGPNLTDEFWLHGGSAEQVYTSIDHGYPDKGMPAWGGPLGARRLPRVAAYVLSLRNTHAPGGKPPQGDRHASKE